MKNSDRVNIEMSFFDLKLIVEVLKESRNKALTWDLLNPGGYPRHYGYMAVSKKAKQLQSTHKYLDKKLKELELTSEDEKVIK